MVYAPFIKYYCHGILVGLLDGGRVPFAAGDLIGAGVIRQRRAGHHGQLHGRRRDRRPGGDSGHRRELDVRPGRVAGPAADVQPQAANSTPTIFPLSPAGSPRRGAWLSFFVCHRFWNCYNL